MEDWLYELLVGAQWKQFPREQDQTRLNNYDKLRKLFMGNHSEVFERVQQWELSEADANALYIVINFPGILSKVCADLLFGEVPKIILGDPGTPEQEWVEQFVDRNKLHTKCYEAALSASWRGDVGFKLSFGLRNALSEEPEVMLNTFSTSVFFPQVSHDDIKHFDGATLAWVVTIPAETEDDEEQKFLRKEIHLPGRIVNELWEMDGEKIVGQVDLTTLPEYEAKGLEAEYDVNVPLIFLEYVPNFSLDDVFWGISDYFDMEQLIDEQNNRLTRIATILDKHSYPKLILPPGVMKYDEQTQRFYVHREDLEALEVNPDKVGDLPKYLVWDAKLDAAFSEMAKLFDMLMLVGELSPAIFGLDSNGRAESGRALRFRLLRTLSKINRKKLYFDEALKNIVYKAQILQTELGTLGFEPVMPRIEWADGLPEDPTELTNQEARKKEAGITSTRSAVRRLEKLEGEELDKEVALIEEEAAKGMQEDTAPSASVDSTANEQTDDKVQTEAAQKEAAAN